MTKDKKIIVIPEFMIVLYEINKLKSVSLSKIKETTGLTYSYLHVIKQEFLRKKWITETRLGTQKLLSLTTKGISIATAIIILFEQLDINDNNIKDFRYKQKKHKKVKEYEVQNDNCNEGIQLGNGSQA